MKHYEQPPDDAQRHADADEAIRVARGIIESGQGLILDTETTGLDGEIIEIAVIDLTGATLFDSLVKPIGVFGGTDVHGITEAEIANAPTFAGIWPDLSHVLSSHDGMVLSGNLVLAWNADFDRRMVHTGIVQAIGTTDDADKWLHEYTQWECIQEMYSQFVGTWDEKRNCYKWQRLSGGHRALGDALATLDKLRYLAAQPLFSEQ